MNYYVEWRLRGDGYNNGYGNGLTLSQSESVRNMKKVSENETETVFENNGIQVHAIHKDNGKTTECRSLIRNNSGKDVYVELLSSFALSGLNADVIYRATSFWSAEGKLLVQKLTDLNMEKSWANHGFRVEKFGQLGSMPVRKWFPFLVLEDSKNGKFLGIQLYCASSWQIEIFRNSDEISVHGGIADRDFGNWTKKIAAGSEFETPKAVIAEGSSLEEVCDALVKAQNPRIAKVDEDLPVIFNEYCTTWGNPSIENLTKTAEKLEGSGVRYLVIDCGWYKPDDVGNWFDAAGDWIPSKKLFPQGLKSAADMIRSHGFIPGIWYELENVGPVSSVFNKTEYLLSRDGFPVTVGTRRFWDMRQKWVWDYLEQKVIQQIKDCGIGYLKVDYNETIGQGVDGAESPGEGLRQCVCKSQDYFRHIAEEIPELVIENCASGGHRLEPSMMELVSQASFSDAHEAKDIPLVAANLHRLIRPEQSQIWAVLRADADINRINFVLTSGFLGRLCLSGEIFDLSDESWNAALEAIKLYGKVSHIIKNGYTKLIQTNVENYLEPKGYQIVLREYKEEALLIVHTFEDGANPPVQEILSGYKITESFGSELDGDFRGKVFFLRK
ncbi:MAG: alpha-galactosidase [Treponema sp.]|nr:alpha-galactosidase [Treponema sp.]